MHEVLKPILPGKGGSDYERYLRTDELLSLQKTADEWVHRDELLFFTVHQSSELWLKHAWNEVEEATPVELLAGLIKNKMFPELWRVRTDLTELAKESE